jgi:hypothetical protein
MPSYTADFRTDADYATHTFKARYRIFNQGEIAGLAAGWRSVIASAQAESGSPFWTG